MHRELLAKTPPKGMPDTFMAMKRVVESNGLLEKFNFLKGKRPPHAFILPTNKSWGGGTQGQIFVLAFSPPGKMWGEGHGGGLC